MIRAFNQYYSSRGILFFLMESLLISTAVLLAVPFRFILDPERFWDYDLLFLKAGIVTVIAQLCFAYNELYRLKNGRYYQDLIWRLGRTMVAVALILAFVYYWFPTLRIGRGVLLISLAFCAVFIVAWRNVYRWMADRHLLNERLLIIGSGPLAKEIGTEVLTLKPLGYQIVGFIDRDPAKLGMRVVNPAVIGGYEHLSEISDREKVNRIVVALDEQRGSLPMDALLRCKLLGIRVEEGVSFYEQITGKISLAGLKPSWLIFSDGFEIGRGTRLLKRASDIVWSLLGLALSAPLFLVLPFLIRLDSRGPVFYRQERVGEGGGTFTLIKLRSMREDAEADRGAVWASENDARITRLGGFLRRLRIDELPQLWNVLKGEMSFVGPRPERPEFVEKLTAEIPYYRLRFSVKPGITGWAQVRYRYGATVRDAKEKLQYELFYIKHLSLSLDLGILISTIRVVLSRNGAR